MIAFTVYDETTGRVLSTGLCPEAQLEFQGAGHSVAIGDYPSDKYYWDGEFKPLPEKPDGFYRFDYTTKQWVEDTTQTILLNKPKRNAKLAASDWTQLPDVPLTEVQKQAWATYRQKLRDMTEDDLINGNFPNKPY